MIDFNDFIALLERLAPDYPSRAFQLLEPPVLPRIPECVIVRRHISLTRDPSTWNWKELLHRDSAKVEAPIDPIKVKHDAFFAGVFKDLGVNVIEIPNRYGGSKLEPWYTFRIGLTDYVVGPRHRVFSVEALYPDSRDLSRIAALAKADQVTYVADSNDKVLIHAWNREKLIQYLSTLMEIGAAAGR